MLLKGVDDDFGGVGSLLSLRHRDMTLLRNYSGVMLSLQIRRGGLGASTMRDSELHARFERMVMPHRKASYNLAFWLLGNRDEAEDAVQDAFLRAFRAFAAFKGNAVKPWLLVIVRNVAYTALQARKRASNVIVLADDLMHLRNDHSADAVSQAPSPEGLVIAAAERRELLVAFQRLPVKFRDVLVLREMEGLSYSEIAAVTDTPIGTVMSRLSRAREELRRVVMSHVAP